MSQFLEIHESQLLFIIDLLKGNPNEIYGFTKTGVDAKYELKDVQNDLYFNQARSSLISHATGLSFDEVKKVGQLWIFHYNLTREGQNFMKELSVDFFGIHHDFFKILAQNTEKEEEKQGLTRKKNIRRFLRLRLQELNEGNYKWVSTQKDSVINKVISSFKDCLKDSDNQGNSEKYEEFFSRKFSAENNDSKSFYEVCQILVLLVDGHLDTFERLMKTYGPCGGNLLRNVFKVFSGDYQYIISTLMLI